MTARYVPAVSGTGTVNVPVAPVADEVVGSTAPVATVVQVSPFGLSCWIWTGAPERAGVIVPCSIVVDAAADSVTTGITLIRTYAAAACVVASR